MRNRLTALILFILLAATKVFSDTSSVAADSAVKPFTPPNQGPLGVDINTGLALYGAAILFAILIIALWRKSIIRSKKS